MDDLRALCQLNTSPDGAAPNFSLAAVTCRDDDDEYWESEEEDGMQQPHIVKSPGAAAVQTDEQSEKSITEEDPSDEWVCLRCTLRNESSENQCAACLAVRPTRDTSGPQTATDSVDREQRRDPAKRSRSFDEICSDNEGKTQEVPRPGRRVVPCMSDESEDEVSQPSGSCDEEPVHKQDGPKRKRVPPADDVSVHDLRSERSDKEENDVIIIDEDGIEGESVNCGQGEGECIDLTNEYEECESKQQPVEIDLDFIDDENERPVTRCDHLLLPQFQDTFRSVAWLAATGTSKIDYSDFIMDEKALDAGLKRLEAARRKRKVEGPRRKTNSKTASHSRENGVGGGRRKKWRAKAGASSRKRQ